LSYTVWAKVKFGEDFFNLFFLWAYKFNYTIKIWGKYLYTWNLFSIHPGCSDFSLCHNFKVVFWNNTRQRV